MLTQITIGCVLLAVFSAQVYSLVDASSRSKLRAHPYILLLVASGCGASTGIEKFVFGEMNPMSWSFVLSLWTFLTALVCFAMFFKYEVLDRRRNDKPAP